MGYFSLLQGHFWILEIYFKFFLVLLCFYDEVKQLSSWKLFDMIKFGNRISTPKYNHSKFRNIFEY